VKKPVIRILLIHTGGTIGMSQSAHGLAPCENLVENFARDYAARCPDLELHVESFSPLIDSANITVDHWNSPILIALSSLTAQIRLPIQPLF
jgi:L-asparaginase